MAWQVRLESRVEKELDKIGSADRERILRYLFNRVATLENPRDLGEALAGSWSGHWKYRLGDYRIIAKLEDRIVTVTVVKIGNRREVYR
ncbi:MAG: type II toxin-antitoxin system RelE/ParE family toxin [Proteobacteria bacterium]|nr:type II toxin-antitoxin system RelE/ParE family toxin [Pseudomonadota bacterium]